MVSKTPLLRSLGLTLLSVCFALAAQAQYQFASQPDKFTTGGIPPGAINTGTAVVNYLQVMVCDGPTPIIAWDQAGATGVNLIQGAGLPGFTDPDVVIDPVFGSRILIVYIADLGSGPEGVYEMWSWNSGTMMMFPAVPPTAIGTGIGPLTINVDVSGTYNCPIAWDVGGNIFARNFSLSTGIMSPMLNVTGGCLTVPATYRSPDVATLYHSSSGTELVTFTYIKTTATAQEVIIKRAPAATVIAGGTLASCAFPDVNTAISVPLSIDLDKPRVAAPWDYAFLSPYDCEVVIGMDVPSQHRIYGFTHDASTYGIGNIATNLLNVSPFDITPCGGQSSSPTVTWSGDFIIVAWQYLDCMGSFSGDRDILVRQLTWDGVPFFNEYSVANMNIGGDQIIPSVAGRYMAVLNAHTYFTWFDTAFPDLMYKDAPYFNQNLLPTLDGFDQLHELDNAGNQATATTVAEVTSEDEAMKVWPNPATNNVFVSMPDNVEQIIVRNVLGAEVMRVVVTSPSQTSLEISALTPGTYTLEAQTNNGAPLVERFIKR